MVDHVRRGDGFDVEIADPPRYERFVKALANLTVVPLSWLGILAGNPPAGWERAQYRVQMLNPKGKRWTIAMTDSLVEAIERRQRVIERIDEVGFDCWSREGPIPDEFFG